MRDDLSEEHEGPSPEEDAGVELPQVGHAGTSPVRDSGEDCHLHATQLKERLEAVIPAPMNSFVVLPGRILENSHDPFAIAMSPLSSDLCPV